MLHIIHGNGKGKTTSAFGMALRMAGHDKKVLVLQFLKNGDSGEMKAMDSFVNVTTHAIKLPQKFYFQMDQEEKSACERAQWLLFQIAESQSSQYDCVILDEILDVLNLQIIDEESFLKYVSRAKRQCEIVLTGRNPSAKLKECADYETEVVMKQHPYEKGLQARKGVEY